MVTLEKTTISNAEWEIMRVVWATGKTTSKEISSVLNDKMNWKSATTKTLIGRLVKKGLLKTETEGNRYWYIPIISEEESLKNASNGLLSNICTQKAGTVIAELLEEATLSHKDVQRLEELLEQKKREAVEEVPCLCVPGQCQCAHHM